MAAACGSSKLLSDHTASASYLCCTSVQMLEVRQTYAVARTKTHVRAIQLQPSREYIAQRSKAQCRHVLRQLSVLFIVRRQTALVQVPLLCGAEPRFFEHL